MIDLSSMGSSINLTEFRELPTELKCYLVITQNGVCGLINLIFHGLAPWKIKP